MKLSIVATLYQSAQYVDEFWRRASAAARQIVDDDYEIILVNDGSPDNSLELAARLCESDSHLIVVDLSRNFGHHKAMMTGLAHAQGERVFLLDSDLEEEPEWLLCFAEQMAKEHCDVVYGVQKQRRGSFFERWSGRLFYSLLRLLSGLALPENIVTARLMSRRYVQALLRHEERELNIGGLWHLTGFDQQPQLITKHSASETTYTLRKKMTVLIDAVTSFSNAPLVGIFYVGLLISTAAAVYATYLITNYLVFTKPLSGFTSIMASIWLLGGLIISFIGVIGIYLSKIFSETKQRPYTIVRQVYGRSDH
jgi:putative glycosyltransferase